MDSPLPSNEDLVAFSEAIPWQQIEEEKRKFNALLKEIASESTDDELPLDRLSEEIGVPISVYYGLDDTKSANIFLADHGSHQYILGSVVSSRYRSGKTLAKSIVSYNINPSVNHTNLHETDDPTTQMRALGAELELGLLHPDGSAPSEEESKKYIDTYQLYARRLGITPEVDREACQYQVEVHIAPGVGYQRTRAALDGIMAALAASSEATGLNTAILSSYPIHSDFKLTNDPKVKTAVDLMCEVNAEFPEYVQRLDEAKKRYHMKPDANVVEVFRLQGCHIHLDLAGRSEGLALLAFYTLLRSASAVANSAILKGGPFVNGYCDDKLLCTREYLRRTTVTGNLIEVPLSPHLVDGDLERYASLLKSERANAVARAHLYDGNLQPPISAMHSLLGRLRPDLGSNKRICTLESTGMPVNISASRQAAVLTDFEFMQALVEAYFRKHGLNLEPMYEDQTLWAILGPLDLDTFHEMHDRSDVACSDMIIRTAVGTEMTLAEFYEMKREYLLQHLPDELHISPRSIDEVYASLNRMLEPPTGQVAETIEQYIHDYKLRSTGNWGKILLNAFIEEGGVPGSFNPDAVLRVTNRIHDALRARYLPT